MESYGSELLKRFGVTVDWRGATIDNIRALAVEADRLGFGHFWIPEAWGLEAFSTASLLVNATDKIQIGTGVVNVFSRSAALIGMSAVTICQQGKGSRFNLGLGISGEALIEDWHGIKFERPLERLREYVQVIRRVVRGEKVDHEGKLFKLKRFGIFTETGHSTNLEIYLGVMGKKSLALAGVISDGAILTLYPKSRLRNAAELVSSSFQTITTMSAGNRERRVFAFYPLQIANTDQELRDRKSKLARYVSFYVASMGNYYARNLSELGLEEEVRRIREAYASGEREKAVNAVSEEMLEELAFVGAPNNISASAEILPDMISPVFGLDVSSSEDTAESIRALRKLADFLQ